MRLQVDLERPRWGSGFSRNRWARIFSTRHCFHRNFPFAVILSSHSHSHSFITFFPGVFVALKWSFPLTLHVCACTYRRPYAHACAYAFPGVFSALIWPRVYRLTSICVCLPSAYVCSACTYRRPYAGICAYAFPGVFSALI